MTQSSMPHPLNAVQLELLFDLRNVKVLRLLRLPDTASGVATALGLPANLTHYRINRLVAADLLRVIAEHDRPRTYQTVYETFTVPQEVRGELGDALPTMLELLLNRVYRTFFAEFEKMSHDLAGWGEPEGEIIVDLERNLGVEKSQDTDALSSNYVPRAVVTSVRLSKAGYEALAASLREFISAAADEESGESCTFAVLSYQGRSLE